MAYLDNTTEITIDAVLTRRGREKLAQNRGTLQITKFALSDDEIDYSLYDTAHPKGSAYYDAAIRALPILEAGVDETQVMKNLLMTMPRGTTQIPTINIGNVSFTGANSIKIYADRTRQSTAAQTVTISTFPQSAATQNTTFTIIVADKEAVQITAATPLGSSVSDMTAIYNLDGTTFQVVPITDVTRSFSTTITIIGNQTGASITVPIEVEYIPTT
jgi:hypothetical protein